MRDDAVRRGRTLSALGKEGLDAVVCGSPTGVLLLTGYWPVMGGSVAILTSSGELRLVLPDDESELAGRMSSAPLVPYKPAGKNKLTTPMEALAGPLGSTLHDLRLDRAKLGLPMGRGVQPVSYAVTTEFHLSLHRILSSLLPGAQLVACDALLDRLKAVKTPQEIARLRQACAVAGDGFKAVEAVLEPGLREMEVAARVQAAFHSSPAAEALVRHYGFFFCMSGPNAALAAAAFAHTRQRRLQVGDLVLIHANTCADGMWTDITRTYTVGPRVERHEQLRAAITEARAAALATIHPGARASEVDRAARSVMERHSLGEAFKHATGHGVGFDAANAHGLPRIHPSSPDVLEPGSSFNVEPAAYFDGYGGMRHCDVVVVGDSGAEVLSDWS